MMIAVGAVGAAVLFGWMAGGRLGNLEMVRLRWAPVLLALFIVQGLARGRLVGLLPAAGAARLIWVVVSLGMCAILLGELKTPGIPLIVGGFALNLLVVLANSGMPVVVEVSETARAAAAAGASAGFYLVANGGSLLRSFADSIPLVFGRSTLLISAGDLLSMIGVVVTIVAGMCIGANAGVYTSHGRS